MFFQQRRGEGGHPRSGRRQKRTEVKQRVGWLDGGRWCAVAGCSAREVGRRCAEAGGERVGGWARRWGKPGTTTPAMCAGGGGGGILGRRYLRLGRGGAATVASLVVGLVVAAPPVGDGAAGASLSGAGGAGCGRSGKVLDRGRVDIFFRHGSVR